MRKCTARVWVKPVPKHENVPHQNGYWKTIAGFFHQFGQSIEEYENGGCTYTIAIIEDIEGQMWEVELSSVKFDEPIKD
jgi:hypothetical protein